MLAFPKIIMNLSIDPKTVKGFLDPEEGEALYNNALLYSLKGPCLEIGSYCGKSALYIIDFKSACFNNSLHLGVGGVRAAGV